MKVWIAWDDENYSYSGEVFATKEAGIKHYGKSIIKMCGITFKEVEVIA